MEEGDGEVEELGDEDLLPLLVYWCQGRRGCRVASPLVERWAGAGVRWHQGILSQNNRFILKQ